MYIKPAHEVVTALVNIAQKTPVLERKTEHFAKTINDSIEKALDAATPHIKAVTYFRVSTAFLEYLRTRIPQLDERVFFDVARDKLAHGTSDLQVWLGHEFALLRAAGFQILKTDAEVQLRQDPGAREPYWLEVEVKLEFVPADKFGSVL
jgi:hypothetical protein